MGFLFIKPFEVKHGLADERGFNEDSEPELQTNYHEYFAFFSSNACIFYQQTELGKNDCPTGNFLCDGNNTPFFYEWKNLTYNEAIDFCHQRNSSLSKYLLRKLHFKTS